MITLQINNQSYTVDAPGDMPLLWVLRDLIGLTGTKYGCGVGRCGACTVHLDGKAEHSCKVSVGSVGKRAITTIEAIGNTPNGARIQKAWIETKVAQCGYCQAGQIMTATALLNHTPKPSDADIDAAMSGTLCRCGTYVRLRQAIKNAAKA
ncbi:MAG: (2Fe-2S)-binding protein [Betaproteobacteria bacterium]|nr:(2Fe-2S)-binding protein [Betaproteobacteria bacterium]